MFGSFRYINRFTALIALFLFGFNLAAAQNPASSFSAEAGQKIIAAIDEYMNAAVKGEHFSGSILVARDGKALVNKGYGRANHELDVPNTPATVFRLASLTKAFTAAAILQLQEKEKLNISEGICKYLENCPAAWLFVTIKHLLTHTSGIPNYTNFPDYERTAALFASNEELVARFRDKPLVFAPGEKYQYSNSGYHLLGMIIEKVSEKSYADYLQENIFAPIGMKNTGLDANKKIIRHRAAGYSLDNDSLVNADFMDMAHVNASGGLYSTTEDLLLWDQALYTEKILSRRTLDEMFTPFKGGYGYGWSIGQLFDRQQIFHSGLVFGFSTQIKRFPADKVTIIVLSNNQMTKAEKVAADLSAIVFGAPYRIPKVAQAVAPQILEKYVGQYQVSPAMTVTVTLENGKVFAQGTGHGKTRIYPLSETTFFFKNVDAEITFNRDSAGNVTGMTVVKPGGEKEEAQRIKNK